VVKGANRGLEAEHWQGICSPRSMQAAMEFALTAPPGLMTPTDLVMPEELPCGILRVLRLRRFDLDRPKWQ
jgi:hypothetical protein